MTDSQIVKLFFFGGGHRIRFIAVCACVLFFKSWSSYVAQAVARCPAGLSQLQVTPKTPRTNILGE